MTTTVLAYLPSPAQGVWHLGPVPIRAYALCIIIGIVAALIIGDRRWQARGGEPGVIYDIALWAVPFGLIGGRLYHVLTDWNTYFGPTGKGLGAAFQVWEGGLGVWGAVALGALGAWIACRLRGIPLPAFGDAIAPGIILAQAIGRLGNYFNQELFGRPTTLPWGLEIYERLNAAGVRDELNGVSTGQVVAVVHPTFLYELLWNVLIFALLIWADRKFNLGHGRLFALYVAGYCVGRFWIELMRSDFATEFAGIRVNTFTSTFVFIGAVVYIMLAPKGREDPATLRGKRAETEESPVDEVGKEFVTAAATTGVVAAAAVAGKSEAEDAAAVGDTDADHMHTDEVVSDDSVDAAAAVELKAVAPEPDHEDSVEQLDEDEVTEGDAREPDAAEATELDTEGAPAEPEAEEQAEGEPDSDGTDATEPPSEGDEELSEDGEPEVEGAPTATEAEVESAEIAESDESALDTEGAPAEPEAEAEAAASQESDVEPDAEATELDTEAAPAEPEAEDEAPEAAESVEPDGEAEVSDVVAESSTETEEKEQAAEAEAEADTEAPADGEAEDEAAVDEAGEPEDVIETVDEPEQIQPEDEEQPDEAEAEPTESTEPAEESAPEAEAETEAPADGEAEDEAATDEAGEPADVTETAEEPEQTEPEDVEQAAEAEAEPTEPAAEAATSGEAEAETPVAQPASTESVAVREQVQPEGGRFRRWLRRNR